VIRKFCLSAIFLLLLAQSHSGAPENGPAGGRVDAARKPIHFRSPVQDKNFYFLSLIEEMPDVAKALASDAALASITESKLLAESRCHQDLGACLDGAAFRPSDVTLANKLLLEHFGQDPHLESELAAKMRSSGLFERYAGESDREMVSEAWSDAARGINRILKVYGNGQPPHYARIDSSSFNLASPAGKIGLAKFSAKIAEGGFGPESIRNELWFRPSLQLALFLLEVNHRDEAGRFEPLDQGENAAGLAKLPHVAWNRYTYSAILVPGLGPEKAGIALDPGGFKRIALAAKRFREGLAPYILVSGGNVHPAQTPFCEALEMKRALIRDLGIPAEAILVEPQARHTTTNIRNASRLLYRYNFPLNLPVMITTDEYQTSSIRSPEFVKRSEQELGYVPFRNLRPLSPTDTAFNIQILSLQADSSDPLDP
jgi:hypothetical protein